MYCNKCGKRIPDDSVFCPECGASVGKKVRQEQREYEYKEQQDNHGMIAIVAGVAVLLIVILLGVFFISSSNKEKEMEAMRLEKEQAEEKAKAAEAEKEEAAKKQQEEAEAAAKEAEVQETQEVHQQAEEHPDTVNNYYYYGTGYRVNDYYSRVPVDGYLWPTDSYYLSYSDLDFMTKDTIDAMRNEIYARHGYAFQKQRWINYFGSKSWYYRDEGCTQDVAKARMNSIEKKNLATIVRYSEDKGWR